MRSEVQRQQEREVGWGKGLETVDDSLPEEVINLRWVRMCDVIFLEDREPIKR